MMDITHTRVRWNSVSGVQFVPLEYGRYPAEKGYTDIRYAYIDLDKYEIDHVVKPNFTVPRIASEAGAELAVNGPFAYTTSTNATPLGYFVKDGKLFNTDTSVPQWIDFIVRKNGRIEIGQIDPANVDDIALSFSATPEIVRDGKIYVNVFGEQTPKDIYARKRARTGLGITKDKRLLIVVVDEDKDLLTKSIPKWDAGLRVDELAAVMIELGVFSAMNLDGGGSSVMVQNGTAISANKGSRRLGAAVVFRRKQRKDIPNQPLDYHYRIAHILKRPNTRPTTAMVPRYLMTHTTNNFRLTATAEAHRRLLNQTQDYVSYHIVTDDLESIEMIPFNERGYHAGDGGNGHYGSQSIGHEICVNKLEPDGKLNSKTYQNAVETSARIIAEYGVELVQHRDVPERSWKNCTYESAINFVQFKRDVLKRSKELSGLAERLCIL